MEPRLPGRWHASESGPGLHGSQVLVLFGFGLVSPAFLWSSRTPHAQRRKLSSDEAGAHSPIENGLRLRMSQIHHMQVRVSVRLLPFSIKPAPSWCAPYCAPPFALVWLSLALRWQARLRCFWFTIQFLGSVGVGLGAWFRWHKTDVVKRNTSPDRIGLDLWLFHVQRVVSSR